MRDADVVVHLAFMIMGGAEREPARSTSTARATSSRRAPRAGVSRLVYTSSVAAYGFHPDNPQPLTEDVPARGTAEHYYSAQKAEVEQLLAVMLAPPRRAPTCSGRASSPGPKRRC